MTTQENKRIVREFVKAAYNDHLPNKAGEFMSDDIKWHGGSFGGWSHSTSWGGGGLSHSSDWGGWDHSTQVTSTGVAHESDWGGAWHGTAATPYGAYHGSDYGGYYHGTTVGASSDRCTTSACRRRRRSAGSELRVMPQRRSSSRRTGRSPTSLWNGEPINCSTTACDSSAISTAAHASRLLPMPASPCNTTPGVFSAPAFACAQDVSR